MEQGGLSVRDLEMLTREAAELHERLIILRYKAYDTIVKPEQTDVSVSENNPIRITVPENQINLIDAIEEVENGGDGEPEVQEEGTPFRLDFGMDEDFQSESENVSQEEIVVETESESVVEEEEHIAQEESESENEIESADEELVEIEAEAAVDSVPEEIVEEVAEEEYVDNSLAEKLRKSPIQDLRKSIGLNQKFQFISELFDGDNQSYDALVESLNTAPSLEKAMSHLNDKQKEHEWETEGKTYLQLKELVERRHA